MHTYDTAGQEQFRSLSENYYKKADCCLLVYDITKIESFEECLGYYNKCIHEKCKKNIPVILLGNKSDLEDKRVITSEDGALFSEQNGYMFMETSCLKNTNVSNAFETLIELTNREMQKNNNDLRRKGTLLKKNKIKRGRKCSCKSIFK